MARILLIAAVTTLPLSVYAALPNPRVNIYAGVGKANVHTSDLSITSDSTDRLSHGHAHNRFTHGVGVAFDCPHDISLGADFFVFDTTHHGVVYQYGNPDFGNYNYHLRFKTKRLMLDSAFSFRPLWRQFSPFVKASVGVVRITTKYDESPKSADIVEGDLNLRSRTDHNAAFSLGAGVKKPLSKNLQLSILYLYTDLGTARTSRESYDNGHRLTIAKPITAKLKINTGLIALSWLFD